MTEVDELMKNLVATFRVWLILIENGHSEAIKRQLKDFIREFDEKNNSHIKD